MKHSIETKIILSKKRKKWLSDNPDKHPWKTSKKFISKPCEILKEKLLDNGIEFHQEYKPLLSKNYSIDIAIPEKLIGFEVNGNQHYNSDKTLKDYYNNRKNEIEKEGWQIYDIHYTKVFDDNFIKEVINFINGSNIINLEFEIFKKVDTKCDCGKIITKNSKRCIKCHNISRRTERFYREKKEKKEKVEKICLCGNKISNISNMCKRCFDIKQRKIKNRPNIEELISEISILGYKGTGRKYGVSDNCIRKWIKMGE